MRERFSPKMSKTVFNISAMLNRCVTDWYKVSSIAVHTHSWHDQIAVDQTCSELRGKLQERSDVWNVEDACLFSRLLLHNLTGSCDRRGCVFRFNQSGESDWNSTDLCMNPRLYVALSDFNATTQINLVAHPEKRFIIRQKYVIFWTNSLTCFCSQTWNMLAF